MLVARRLLLGEHQRRLHLFYLCLIGADLRLLHTELRVDGLDVGLRSGHLRLCLGERDEVIAIVDACDHAAGGNVLVVRYRHRRDVAWHLRGDGDPPR